MAAWSDWKYYRIPNRLIIFGIVSGIMSLVFQAADLEAGSKILSNKKIEKYYDPVRDGTECVIPLGTCFCMATVLVFLEKWIF